MSPIEILILALICLLFLAVLAGFMVLQGYVLFRMVERRLRRCPNCNRSAGKIIESETEPLRTQLDRTGKELVRVESERVTDHYQCENCGHKWTHAFDREERKPVKGTPGS
jgi:DNA-directed RNA polymerase subunit RPC12/RpoP